MNVAERGSPPDFSQYNDEPDQDRKHGQFEQELAQMIVEFVADGLFPISKRGLVHLEQQVDLAQRKQLR